MGRGPRAQLFLVDFDAEIATARRALAAAGDEDFMKPWTLKWAGRAVWTKLKHEVHRVWAMNHLVHHRAQLSVFLRLLDVPIPGSYGPTADERPG